MVCGCDAIMVIIVTGIVSIIIRVLMMCLFVKPGGGRVVLVKPIVNRVVWCDASLWFDSGVWLVVHLVLVCLLLCYVALRVVVFVVVCLVACSLL